MIRAIRWIQSASFALGPCMRRNNKVRLTRWAKRNRNRNRNKNRPEVQTGTEKQK